ncbi:MAG TPA: hypothetical protein VF832_07930 [Longimicrobiales bacterium]
MPAPITKPLPSAPRAPSATPRPRRPRAKPAPGPVYTHVPHPHQPRHPLALRREEAARRGALGGWPARVARVNEALALHLTGAVGTMWAAYAFVVLALSGFPGPHASAPQLVQWFSQTFLQLVMLPILAVGTAVLGREAARQAIEMYKNVLRILHDLEQVMRHLDAQDTAFLKRLADLEAEVTALRAHLPEAPRAAAPHHP